MESKFKQLQNKLNSLSQPHEEQLEHSNKAKIRNIQQILGKLQQKYDEETMLYELKINTLFDNVRKIQVNLKDSSNELQIQQTLINNKLAKMEKNIRKNVEKLSKERKQTDKKIQNTLENYLIELTTFKGKANANCQATIRELKDLEKDVQHLDKEVKREAQLSKDIYNKIYSQFSIQIQQIKQCLMGQQRERQQQSQKIMESIQKMYKVVSGSIVQSRKERQKYERQIVDLLQKVIQKLKYQIFHD